MAVLPFSHPTDFERGYQMSFTDVDEIHQAMLEEERKPAATDELVKIGYLSPECEEYDVLATSGVSNEALDNGKVVRGSC